MNEVQLRLKTVKKLLSFAPVCSTKKVILVVTKSRKEHLIVQTHEIAYTKELLPQVIAKGTFKVLCRVCYECMLGLCVVYDCVSVYVLCVVHIRLV